MERRCYGRLFAALSRRFCARAVRPAGEVPAKGATGTRAPSGRPGGRLSSGPSRPGRACSRAPCESPLGPWGSPGLPCGTRVTAISVLVRSSACRSTPWLTLRAVAMQPLGGRRFRRHCWRFLVSGFPRPPGARSSNTRAYLPGADRCHAGCWIRAPRRKQRRDSMRTGLATGDNAAVDAVALCALHKRHPRAARRAKRASGTRRGPRSHLREGSATNVVVMTSVIEAGASQRSRPSGRAHV